MPAATLSQAQRGRRSYSGWAIWSQPVPLVGYLIAVEAAALAATGVAASMTRWRIGDMVLLAALVACGAAAIEATRQTGEPHGSVVRDMHAVWFIAAAVLLPPIYVLIAPAPLAVLKLWRTPGVVAYRRIFSAAANALAYGCASVVFHALPDTAGGPIADGGAHIIAWTVGLGASGAIGLLLNNALLLVAIRLSDPEARIRELAANREAVSTDLLQLGLAVLITVPVGIRPLLLAAAVPAVLAQRRFIMHSQLVAESRIDPKTGLLNAITWQREARVELDRAARTGAPLAVAIADIDHFKAVNDTHGHLVGDTVLATLAATMRALLRDYDILGRFGGEEFTILLPHTSAAEAAQVAERLRRKISQLTITPDSAAAPDTQLHVTISIGMAAAAAARRDLNDLVAAADVALYRAKDQGRNQVQILTDPVPGSAV
jgi:diguanylate cyclase (GGDEF)-like protein